MKFVLPFGIARKTLNTINVEGELRVSASYDDMITFIRTILSGVEVDEEWYLQTYEDIGEGIREGSVKTAAVRWTPSAGQESGRLKRESRPLPMPLPIRGERLG
jgi:hypothetical protein